MKVKGLRGLIYSMYESESECAKAMNWTRQRLNKITTGQKIPSLIEANELARALGTSVDTIASFF